MTTAFGNQAEIKPRTASLLFARVEKQSKNPKCADLSNQNKII